jgi:hypothetical protein
MAKPHLIGHCGTGMSETMLPLWLSVPHARSCGSLVIAVAVIAIASARAAEPPPSCANRSADATLPSADIVPNAPAKPPVQANDAAVQAQPPGCAEWTDRCVTCRRAGGKTTCSNIGIACQAQAVECLRSEPAQEKRQGN